MKKHLVIILFTTLVFSCKKKIETPKVVLPEATQVGANTAGCTIDGVNYRADGSVKKSGLASYYYYPISISHAPWDYSDMKISISFNNNWTLKFNIFFEGLIGNINFNSEYINKNPHPDIYYKLVTSKPHNLTFTNVTGLIRAGTFDFYVANENDSTDIKHITNGRFDVMDLY